MMVQKDYSLKQHNTFGIEVAAREFVRMEDPADWKSVASLPSFKKKQHLILGGGSNVLFTGDYDGLLIHVASKGKRPLREEKEHVIVEAQSGEEWDELVSWCVGHGWGGLENLSMIPGQVGAGPIQNIGAYGAELKDHFHSLDALDKASGKIMEFGPEQCQFGYRSSHFKQGGKNRYLILRVRFRLDKKHRIKTGYAALARELDAMNVCNPDIATVREAVCRVRSSKLPDPGKLGNAGSFFKNPVVSVKEHMALEEAYPQLVSFPSNGGVKLAAGWLIEQAGWKGYRKGDAGVHDKQALVLVNHGGASGQDILELARRIQRSVREKFHVNLEPEVNIL